MTRLVSRTGTAKNRPSASASATTTVPAHMPLEISSSSGAACAFALASSALKPMASDWASAATPRTTGRRSARRRRETIGCDWTAISPSGVREATAQVETPRIITPSSTAWPPTAASRWTGRSRTGLLTPPTSAARPRTSGGSPAALALGRPALEALDAPAGVHELLLARVEGMAVGADLDVHVALGRAGDELVPARAAHRRLDVLRMDFGLHSYTKCSASAHRAEGVVVLVGFVHRGARVGQRGDLLPGRAGGAGDEHRAPAPGGQAVEVDRAEQRAVAGEVDLERAGRAAAGVGDRGHVAALPGRRRWVDPHLLHRQVRPGVRLAATRRGGAAGPQQLPRRVAPAEVQHGAVARRGEQVLDGLVVPVAGVAAGRGDPGAEAGGRDLAPHGVVRRAGLQGEAHLHPPRAVDGRDPPL